MPSAISQVAALERQEGRVEGTSAFGNRRVISGEWQLSNGRLMSTDEKAVYGRVLLGDHPWVDCVVKARIKINSCSKEEWSGLRIIVRADDECKHFYTVGLCLSAQRVFIEKAVGGDPIGFKNCVPCPSAPYRLEIGRTYEVEVVVDHAALHCFIDGTHVITASCDDFLARPAGKVGFYSACATGEVSYVSIDSLERCERSPFRMYKENPLDIDARSPVIVRDGELYKMWFDAGGDLGYAESTDGLHWKQPVPPINLRSARGRWGDGDKNDAEVLKLGDKYWLFYPCPSSRSTVPAEHGPNWWDGMGLQFSDDGIHWTPYEHNPNFYMGPAGSWDENVVGDHSWIKDGDRFKLWFTGINHGERGYRNEFGYAESADGIHWKKCRLNPILRMGSPGDWDGGWMSCAAVIKLGGDGEELSSGVYRGGKGSYHLFYTGWPTNVEFHAGGSQIGYAYSLDGVHWVKYHDPRDVRLPYRHSTPVVGWADYGKWGCGGYHSCALLQEGDEVRMWIWGWGMDENRKPVSKLGLATAQVADLLAIVEQAKQDGRLVEFDRQQIDQEMYDAPPPVRGEAAE